MNRTYRTIIALLILIPVSLGVAGCGSPQATEQAAVESTAPAWATQMPVATPLPPLPSPEPTETVAPTAIPIPPTPTPAGQAPTIINLEDISISDGERFPTLKLDEYVSDEDHAATKIDWQISGNEQLGVRLVGRNLIVTLPVADWTGAETLRFKACDPDGLCDAREVVLTVRQENDAPIVRVGGQIILNGEAFAPILLDNLVYDEEQAGDELAWHLSGGEQLGMTVQDGIATIEMPEVGWQGQETIHFEACDSEGACDARDATFLVLDRTDTPAEITYIGNAGFMITVGDKKILIDALFQEPAIPSDVTDALLAALPPFDDVDLILATHSHFDHFSAEKVARHLENNPGAIFVSAQDAANAVNQLVDVGERIIPIRLQQKAGESTQLAVNGIGLECIYLSHGGGILNLGFIITTEGRRFFHTGDIDPDSVPVSELQQYGLPDKQIDVTFVPHFMLIKEGQQAHLTEGIQARYIVPMHFQFTMPSPDYDLMARSFPQAIVFRHWLESWTMTD